MRMRYYVDLNIDLNKKYISTHGSNSCDNDNSLLTYDTQHGMNTVYYNYNNYHNYGGDDENESDNNLNLNIDRIESNEIGVLSGIDSSNNEESSPDHTHNFINNNNNNIKSSSHPPLSNSTSHPLFNVQHKFTHTTSNQEKEKEAQDENQSKTTHIRQYNEQQQQQDSPNSVNASDDTCSSPSSVISPSASGIGMALRNKNKGNKGNKGNRGNS